MIDIVTSEQYDVNWPGWPLTGNKYGDEFDEPARIRMIVGGRKLIPYLVKYNERLGEFVLEIGPFFNPLMFHEHIKSMSPGNRQITFLENDPFAVHWLKQQQVASIFDINIKSPVFQELLHQKITEYTWREPCFTGKFDTIIISQVLNYVDHSFLLQSLFPLLRNKGLVFINNVIDYGIPVLFSKARPRKNEEIKEAARTSGFNILEETILPKSYSKEGSGRLILVLTAY